MSAIDNLPGFELPKIMVQPAVRACRLFNTILDVIFYDVPNFALSLPEKDTSNDIKDHRMAWRTNFKFFE
jgi:hypothetical protein